MVFDLNRPPLPAPTEPSTLSSDDEADPEYEYDCPYPYDNDTTLRDDRDLHDDRDDRATNLSVRTSRTDHSTNTDRTSYSIPEDGTPVTINTTKLPRALHKKYPSQTSLLIEYFEASTTPNSNGPRSRPSVRVRVTPSLRKKQSKQKQQQQQQQQQQKLPPTAADAVKLHAIRDLRKPAYVRRISLAGRSQYSTSSVPFRDDDSGFTSLPPIDIEVLSSDGESDYRGSYYPMTSDVSSMPADSMIGETSHIRTPSRRRSRSLEREEVLGESTVSDNHDTLKAPKHQRSRSMSKDRITQRVMEKLQQQQEAANKSSSKSKDPKKRDSHSKRRSRDVRDDEISALSATDSSLLSSNAGRSGVAQSVRSGASGASSSLNNPKLLATVEDAIKRLILPELNALKEEKRTSNNRDKFERLSRDGGALYETVDATNSPKRRVSKSSSTPNISGGKPKVTLSQEGEEVPIVLSGSSTRSNERSKERKSSRSSTSEKSHGGESASRKRSHRKKSRDEEAKAERDAELASLAGSGLTAAALRHHTSREEQEEEAKHRKRSSRGDHSRSHSRSHSKVDSMDDEKPVPPMPFLKSEILGGSEITRDSILSADTETRDRPGTSSSRDTNNSTPLQQVPRGFASSPGPRTPPTRATPTALHRSLGLAHNNHSLEDGFKSPDSTRSYGSRSKDVTSAMAAAAAKARAIERTETQASHYEIIGETPPMSPIQSEASYREGQTASPSNLRSVQSAVSMSSLGRQPERQSSNLSIRTMESTASTKAARTRKRPQGTSLESTKSGSPQTPQGPNTDADLFFKLNHEQNEAYRRELEDSSQLTTTDYNRMTTYTEDDEDAGEKMALGQTIRKVGENPEYIHPPLGVESAVASLHDPSVMSYRSSAVSSPHVSSPLSPHASSPLKKSRLSQVSPAPMDEVLQNDKAEPVVRENSPRQSISQSIDEKPEMHHSAIPTDDHMIPEYGYGMDGSDISTNPSIIQGPLGGDAYYDRNAYLDHQDGERTPTYASTENSFDRGVVGAGAGAGANAHQHQNRSTSTLDQQHQATVEDDYDQSYAGEPYYDQGYAHSNRTPTSGATGWKDEGYASANQREAYTPQNRNYPKSYEDDGYGDSYDDTGMGADDMFDSDAKHTRQYSGNSHGMASPLYDSATGKGIDNIQSKDIVALMDHLTVRDAQRNARDTEILVTLVRSAAEMRNQLDEMKQFIKTQDNMIMSSTEKRVDVAEQRILGGPRPQPMPSVRTARTSASDNDAEAKKKNLFKRALKGLSMKGDGDIKNIEAMLMQLLGDVEGLKQIQQLSLDQQHGSGRSNSLTSYENLRASGDPSGYEPEGRANTNSTPDQSGYLSNPTSSSRRINDLHSGYDVVQTNRISTVHEDDEEYLEREPRYEPSFEDPERMTTPTQDAYHSRNLSQEKTPPEQTSRMSREMPQEETTPKRKHKSNSSSIFGIPKISRWSKTTASTNPESLPRNSSSDQKRPYSAHSRSSSQAKDEYYDDEPYAVREDRSRPSSEMSRRERESIRSPSPLIPDDELQYELEDPKYKAHRNSLNLQHPQPRAGPTGRHQNHLETQAQVFEPVTSPDYDQWGSMPSLARNRMSTGTTGYGAGNMSPISSDGGYSQHSASEQQQQQQQQAPARQSKDDGPLIPTQQTLAGYGQTRQMYSSPNEFGSQGVLTPLPPIAEVRYSLETDSGRYRGSPAPSSRASNSSLRPSAQNSPQQRKITGPRPMGPRSPSNGNGNPYVHPPANPSPLQHSDTVIRRKPMDVDEESLLSYTSTVVSETF